jgi:hypothetical protein
MSDVFYVHAPESNGLFLLNLDCNDSHIHKINAKRCKLSDDSTMYIWYCSLGHIGVKHTKKVHSNGFLKSLDFKSFDICEPYLMGKMTNTPFSNVMNSLQILQIRAMPYVKMTSRRLYRLLWGRRGVTSIVLVYSEFGGGDCTEANTNMFFFLPPGNKQ